MSKAAPVARILSVGDELVSGLTVDTNSAWFSQQLASVGVRTVAHATADDDQAAIAAEIVRHAAACDLLIVSGGIGPTPDDLTREALGDVVGRPVVICESWVEHIRQIWAKRGKPMPEANRKQAGAPEGTELLDNPVGTAAGVAATVGDCRVFVVPGVPREAKAMFADHIGPYATQLSEAAGGRIIRTRALHTFGIGESDLAERLGSLLTRGNGGDLDVGTTAARGVVSVRIYVRAGTVDAAARLMDDVEQRVRDELGVLVFGRDDETLPMAVMTSLSEHRDRPIVSLAESCTGGLIAKLLTDLPGSSAIFHRGVVAYANDVKRDLLGVPAKLLAEHGAVSEPVAKAMASGIRGEGNDLALSVTGIAGPDGGTEHKPVGTVCIALASPERVVSRTFSFHGDRDMVRLRSAYTALAMLRFHLLSDDPLGLLT